MTGILDTWFGGWSDDTPLQDGDVHMKLWWSKDDQVDADLRSRFGAAHLAAAHTPENGWDAPADQAVARILLLDQVPRNIYRGTAHMFATDGLAQAASMHLLGTAGFGALPPIHRYFSLMPLMHAENIELHNVATKAFNDLAVSMAGSPREGVYKGAETYEAKHRAIVERFDRYPHRNALLGRASTAEELAFLAQPGSSF